MIQYNFNVEFDESGKPIATRKIVSPEKKVEFSPEQLRNIISLLFEEMCRLRDSLSS